MVRSFYAVVLGLMLSCSVFAQGMYSEGGKYNYVIFSFFIGVSILFVLALFNKCIFLKPDSLLDWFVISCVLVYVISSITAVSLWDSLFCLSKYLCCYLLYFIAKSTFSSHIKSFYRIVYYIGSASAIYGLYLGLNSFGYDYKKQLLLSVFRYHNASAVFFAILFFIGLYLAYNSTLFEKIAISCCNTLLISSIVYSQSRGMWLVLALAIIFYLIFLRKTEKFSVACSLIAVSAVSVITTMTPFMNAFVARNNEYVCINATACVLYLILSMAISGGFTFFMAFVGEAKIFNTKSVLVIFPVFLLIVVIVLVFFAPASITERIQNFTFSSDTVSERTVFMQDSFKIFSQNPLTGIGGDGWRYVYPSVQRMYYTVAHPHSYFAEMMTDAGILGIVLYLFLLISFAITSIKNKSEDKLTAKIIVFIILVHSFFDFDTDYFTILSILFVSLGIISSGKNKNISKPYYTVIPVLLIIWSVLNIGALYNNNSAVEASSSGTGSPAVVYNYTKSAISLMPINSDYLTVHGSVCRYLGKNDEPYRSEAITVLEKAHRLNRYHYETINQLAYSYLENGDYVKACDTMKILPFKQPFIPKSYEYLSDMFYSVMEISAKTSDLKYADCAVNMLMDGYEHGHLVSSECRAYIEMGTTVHEAYSRCLDYKKSREMQNTAGQ